MSALVFGFFTYNSSVLVGGPHLGVQEDPEGGFIKFAVKRALKQYQIVHMEGKLQVIAYFREECMVMYSIATT